MKQLLFIALSCLLYACGTQRKIPTTVVTEKENKNVEIRYEKIFVHDTAFIEIPAQTAERTTKDSNSFLENDFAESTARVNSDGTLYHDLNTKPQKKPVPTEHEYERRDSIVYVDKEVQVPVPVERELSWWEANCIKWFPYSIIVILLEALVIFKKPMRSLIRRFI
ncbi:hypothetical protein [Phocaeicola faecalis]